MKNLLFVLVFAFAGLAQARSLKPVTLYSELEAVTLDQKLFPVHISLFDLHSAKLEISMATKEVTVKLDFAPSCPPNMLCAQMLQTVERTAELLKVKTGQCGETIYVAKTDKRPVDGNLTSIKVVDHSTDTCKYLIAVPAVEVTLYTKSSGMGGTVEKTYSTFTGSKLQRM